jgi:hypothetical protein
VPCMFSVMSWVNSSRYSGTTSIVTTMMNMTGGREPRLMTLGEPTARRVGAT